MEELALPEVVRRKAEVTPRGEHSWRLGDVEEALVAAEAVGLACLGGQIQFRPPEGTCEAYWLNYGPHERRADEPWRDYVSRSVRETIGAFRRLCQETDFRAAACDWKFMRTKIDRDGYDPTADLWFVLYFEKEQPKRADDHADRAQHLDHD